MNNRETVRLGKGGLHFKFIKFKGIYIICIMKSDQINIFCFKIHFHKSYVVSINKNN